MISLQQTQNTVAAIGVSAPAVNGNAQTIVASLGKLPNKAAAAVALDVATTGVLPPYNEPRCGGTVAGNSLNINGALAQAGAKAVVTDLSKTLLKSVPVVGDILNSLVSLVSLPFAHHKQAVATEQSTLCVAVPRAVQFLQVIDEMLLTGQIDGATAAQAMEQGWSNWRDQVKAILQDTGGKCNAACCYEKYFRAAIEYRKLRIASGAVLDARGSNDQAISGHYLPIPPGSSGSFLPASTGWNAGSPAAPVAQQSVLSLAGFTLSSQQRLALAVVLFFVFVSGVAVTSINRRK